MLAGIVIALASGGALYAAVAGWRVSIPSTPSDLPPGLAAVFFDANVDTTLPRAEAALDLVRAGRVDRVFLIGGARPQREYYGSEVLADRMKALEGADAATWLADRSSFDTVTNLDVLRKYLAATASSEPVYLISDDYHLWRISLLTRKDPLLARRQIFMPVDEQRSLGDHVDRIIWEVGAWLFYAAPPALHRWALSMTRE